MNRKHLWIISLVLFCLSCDNRTAAEMYNEEFIMPGAKGEVVRTELWKGGLLVIHIIDSDGSDSILQVFNRDEILDDIKPEDKIEKLPQSNKCILTRKDSIKLIDCIDLTGLRQDTREALESISQWNRKNINRWIYKNEFNRIKGIN
ncbi:hypothetical protein [[Muricauda] lutisoli]|uniref:Uncharacterized protein n=1 Tax=[Muricauda] lutisoli TaxID=2816035 RepID=A0ABS3ERS2_9FLAO|nr:hypothetical protein [[Muricauda] lutisoli]MBO0328935.1 hypothetical protein [[Muricauda] lutisoli]